MERNGDNNETTYAIFEKIDEIIRYQCDSLTWKTKDYGDYYGDNYSGAYKNG